ncbi:MAG: polysaccharide pyruvyl transferase family protein [Phycisphaerae bacterium]|nr:polysaccharide pyruvyl transferase family protein [Phycisphaerae bacterium]
MNIHHYFPTSTNIGDWFVRDGIRRAVRQVRPDAGFCDLAVNGPKDAAYPIGLCDANLQRSLREADLVIVGGSNLYECRSSGRWGVFTDSDSIDRIDVPVVMIGLGAGSSHRRRRHAPSHRTADEIRRLNAKARASSVRDGLSLRFLKEIGVDDAVLTGCPATFLFDRPLAFRSNGLTVVAMPSRDKLKKGVLLRRRLLSTIRDVIVEGRRRGERVVLACHDARDRPAAEALAGDGAETFCSDKADDYYDLYERADRVLGFRLHACVICLGLGTPFVPLAFDMRAWAFAETYNAADVMIDATGRTVRSDVADAMAKSHRGDREPLVEYFRLRDAYRRTFEDFIAAALADL